MLCVKGDRLKHKIDEKFYTVRIIKNGTFILESENTPNWVYLGDRDLNLYFEPAERREEIG